MGSESSNDTTGIAQRVVLMIVVGGILEPLGMLMYLLWSAPTDLEKLMSNGITLNELIPFLLESPDRLVVAGAIALLAILFGWKANTDTDTQYTHHEGGF